MTDGSCTIKPLFTCLNEKQIIEIELHEIRLVCNERKNSFLKDMTGQDKLAGYILVTYCSIIIYISSLSAFV